MTEEWRPVPGFPGYSVSNLGRVTSHKGRSPIVMSTCLESYGYPAVHLYRDGKPTKRKVHVLVAEAFIGPRPASADVRHLDGDKTNNLLTNLVYGSRSENELDKVRHGTHPQASKTHCKAGHEYTPENTIRTRVGRDCRACSRVRRAAHQRRIAADDSQPHGARRYKGGCRCVECRAAIAAYMRERRAAARLAS